MPKLNNTHLSSRIARELKRLKNGDALVVRNVLAVLSSNQVAALDAAWAAQKQLHRGKRPKSEEERKALGMRNKREIYMEALACALVEARANNKGFLHDAQIAATRRQIEIYTDTINAAKDQGKGTETARNHANNDLTRAGLNRLDRPRRRLNYRDQEVNDLEDQLKARFRDEMTEDVLEQEKLLEQHKKWKDS